MKESEKSKQKKELENLRDFQKEIRIQDQKKIQELLNEIGDANIALAKYIKVIDSQVSFNLSIENTEEE